MKPTKRARVKATTAVTKHKKTRDRDKRNDVPRDLVAKFAALVRQTRAKLEWSQQDLAKYAGVSLMCVWGIEAERRSPSLRIASKIAAALKIDDKLAGFAQSA